MGHYLTIFMLKTSINLNENSWLWGQWRIQWKRQRLSATNNIPDTYVLSGGRVTFQWQIFQTSSQTNTVFMGTNQRWLEVKHSISLFGLALVEIVLHLLVTYCLPVKWYRLLWIKLNMKLVDTFKCQHGCQ